MIALISKATINSNGAKWEMNCANEEKIPLIGLYTQSDNKGVIPPELNGKKVIEWTWEGIAAFINSLP